MTEVRVVDPKTGGEKGSKPCQMSLVPPLIRRRWLNVHSYRAHGQGRDLVDCLLSILSFEEGDDVELESAVRYAADHVVSTCGSEASALEAMGNVYGFGAIKYSRDNYLRGYAWSLSLDALWRHGVAILRGEQKDESGEPHACHVLWHVNTLILFRDRCLGTDDRLWKEKRSNEDGRISGTRV